MGSPRWKRNQRLKCLCNGYWFPHRIKSGTCIHNPNTLNVIRLTVARQGGDVLQAIADYLFDNPEGGQCEPY